MSENTIEQTKLLREIVKWVRFSGMKQVKEVLTSTLNNEKKIIAYHFSDGKNTSRAISELTDVHFATISDWWKEWLSLGIGETISASGGGRFKRSFDLKMFGIKIPEAKQEDSEPQRENIEPTTAESVHE